LLGDFNAKVGREDTFKLASGNESLHKSGNDNEESGKICHTKKSIGQENNVSIS
jgi:hypothetical protein